MSLVASRLIDAVRDELVSEAKQGEQAIAGARDRLPAAVRRHAAGIDASQTLDLLRGVEAELTGVGPLAALLRDPEVTDVLVNGPDSVWVDRGHGLQPSVLTFSSDDEVRRLAVRLACASGRRLDTGVPFVDARLPGGLRLHAVLPPIAVGGVCLSLRIHRRRPFDMKTLIERASVAPPIADLLIAMVDAKLAFLVTGGAGTGKTTLLGALLGQTDHRERLVVVEDAAEVTVTHPHVVRLEARPPNVEGAGEVTLRELVRQALRMRPDRLVVGEVRGPELLDMLLAANTGHEGTMTTLHANGVADVPARVEALAMLAGVERMTAHSLLASAVSAVVHLTRGPDGSRRVSQVACLVRGRNGLVEVIPALQWTGAGHDVVSGPGAASLQARLRSTSRLSPAPVGLR